MRWLMVSRQHHPSHGGIGTYVQRFCKAAHHANWHVELVTQPGEHWPPCSRVHEIATEDMQPTFAHRIAELRRRNVIRPYRYALWMQAVARKLLQLKDEFDVIEFVDCQAEGFAALGCARVRGQHSRSKLIVHAHTPMWIEEAINGCDAMSFGRSIYHEWERSAIARADGVIVTSRVLGEAIGSETRSFIIPYPIGFEQTESPVERERRIVMIGSVQPRKGVDTWACSLSQVLRAKPHATALLIGPDTPTAPDGLSMAAHVQRLIDPRVIGRFYWAGSMPHEQVRSIIASSSLVVVPSRLESFSFVAAEAVLSGTPVVVSARTGIAEHVPSLMTVDAEDVHGWARSQIEALSNPAAAGAIAKACQAEMLESCSPHRVLQMRAQFAGDVKARGYEAASGGDALAKVEAFIESVDDMSLVSSDAS